MIKGIIIFIVFLCPLIFFHELGHFLAARLFGVRVEVFSLGFGPKLFKFVRRGTEYAFSLIPLGGYVKMFGDDPLGKDDIQESEKKYSFTHKGKFARFCIVLAGPMANMLFAYVIFSTLFFSGERLPELRIGVVSHESKFYQAGFRTGDVLRKVNGQAIYSPTDIVFDDNLVFKTITVGRNNNDEILNTNMKALDFFKEFSNLSPFLRKPVFVGRDGVKYAVSLQSKVINWEQSIDQIPRFEKNGSIYLFKLSGNFDFSNSSLASNLFCKEIKFNSGISIIDLLDEHGFRPLDMEIKSINSGSPAELAGLKNNDLIYSLNGQKVNSFDQLRRNLQEIRSETVGLKIWRKTDLLDFNIKPEVKNDGNKDVRLIGVYSSIEHVASKYIHTASKGLFESLWYGIIKTWKTTVNTFEGFKKLIVGSVSFKNIGGPIAIGKIAADSFDTSLSYFFQIMALISINLGIINLFPIPVLDGGHIMFILLEILNRRPLSRRKMEIAQQFGLSLLLLLIFMAVYNDVSRYF